MPIINGAAPRGATSFAYVLAILAAAALVAASAGFGAYFAWTSQQKAPVLAACAVAMALGLELSKPLAVHALFDAVRTFRFGQAFGLFVLAAVAVAYSLTAELQLMALSRADAVAGRSHDAGTATDARGNLARLRGELATITAARSPAEIDPLIAAKLAATQGIDCAGKVPSAQIRGACDALATLRAERARSATRQDLQKRIEAAEQAARAAGPVRVADPSAVALSTFLAALGLIIAPERLGDWLVLVSVFALEAGSMFAVTLVQACRPNTETPTAPHVTATTLGEVLRNTAHAPETPALPAPEHTKGHAGGAPEHGVSSDPPKLAVPVDPAERLLDVIRQRGGELFGSQRALGLMVGVSGTQVNRLVRDLEHAGRVTVQTSKTGTRLALIVG